MPNYRVRIFEVPNDAKAPSETPGFAVSAESIDQALALARSRLTDPKDHAYGLRSLNVSATAERELLAYVRAKA